MSLANSDVIAMVAVKDTKTGREFYEGKLGLKQMMENPGGVGYHCGGGKLFVYQSDTAGSGKATCATWNVADIKAEVADLKSKGVSFETYDMPGAMVENDVYSMGPMKAAWFKDPDGNILSLHQMG